MVKFLFTLETPCPCHDVLSHLKVGAKINHSTFYVSLAKYFVHVLVKHSSDKQIFTYIDTLSMDIHHFHYPFLLFFCIFFQTLMWVMKEERVTLTGKVHSSIFFYSICSELKYSILDVNFCRLRKL